MHMRNLEIDYSIDQLECCAGVFNSFTDGPVAERSISSVGNIGVAFLVECLTKAIADDRLSDDAERTCLVMLDKIKNGIATLRIDESAGEEEDEYNESERQRIAEQGEQS